MQLYKLNLEANHQTWRWHDNQNNSRFPKHWDFPALETSYFYVYKWGYDSINRMTDWYLLTYNWQLFRTTTVGCFGRSPDKRFMVSRETGATEAVGCLGCPGGAQHDLYLLAMQGDFTKTLIWGCWISSNLENCDWVFFAEMANG